MWRFSVLVIGLCEVRVRVCWTKVRSVVKEMGGL